MRHNFLKAAALTVFALSVIAAPAVFAGKEYVSASGGFKGSNTVVLDAGHGGEDGGAVALDGSPEKDLNLAITLKTDLFLNFLGFDTVLTRSEDVMTCDEGLPTLHKRKVSDIKNRLKLIEETECVCSVSIHQNFFGGRASGAQIFYSGNNAGGKLLAQAMQDEIKALCQPENERVIKQATKDIYILFNTTKPAVLAECGFISNQGDLEMLKDEEYQNKLAYAVSLSVLKFSNEGNIN